MIERELTFYDGMLRMLALLGGHCKVSEYGFHNISFADEPVQQETTIDPADSQQSQAGVLTYEPTKADVKAAQLVRRDEYQKIKQELIDIDVLQFKDGKTIFVAENLGDINLNVANSRNRTIRHIRSTCEMQGQFSTYEPSQQDITTDFVDNQQSQALSSALQKTLKVVLCTEMFENAAKRGGGDFNHLIDVNIPIIVESVLAGYQRVLNEIINTNSSFK